MEEAYTDLNVYSFLGVITQLVSCMTRTLEWLDNNTRERQTMIQL